MRSLTPEFNRRFRDLILEISGLSLWGEKHLDSKVLNAFDKSRFSDLEEYYRFLKNSPPSSPEIEQLLKSFTVGETYFFRNKAQFEALKRHIIPEIIAGRSETIRHIRIWCAGCATGEEPYSIAILLRELLPDIANWNITIMATDINQEYLERAKAGVYGEWSFREASPELKQRYFNHRHGKYKISPEINQMVRFYPLNLVRDEYPSPANNIAAMDIILCRNVTIYFHQDKIKQVVERFYNTLINTGWLIIGHSEPSLETYKRFQPVTFPSTLVYKKVNPPLAAPLSLPPVPATAHPKPHSGHTPSKHAESPVSGDCKINFYQRGLDALKSGNKKQALSLFQQEIKQNPDFTDAYYMAAKIYADQGQLDTAAECCKSALKINKLASRVYYLLSLILVQKSHYDEAKESLRKLLYLDQDFIMGHLVLAQIYYRQGHERLARRCLDNAKNILAAMPADKPVPEADGYTAGSLLQRLERDYTLLLKSLHNLR